MNEEQNKRTKAESRSPSGEVKKDPPATPQPQVEPDPIPTVPSGTQVATGTQPPPQPQPSDMEVHKHPHHVTHKKKWSEYLLEFFMIFFAVMLGFLAENTREHIVERKKAKEFVSSMIEDLKRDTANFHVAYLVNQIIMQNMDSLIALFKSPDYNSKTPRLYYLARMIPGVSQPYLSTDRTFNQMKSSGNLRLITNHVIADSISIYYYRIEQLKSQNDLWLNVQDDYIKKISAVFDASIFHEMHKEMREAQSRRLSLPLNKGPLDMAPPPGKPPLANNSSESIAALMSSTHFFFTRTYGMQRFAVNTRASAVNLIELLQTHYHLKDE